MALVLLLFASSLAASPGFSDLFRTGLIALQRGDLAAAESNLQEAAKLVPKNGRVWVALSQTYWKLHQGKKAEEDAEKARTFAPNDPVVLQSLAIYYSESGQTRKAAETQGRYAALNPADSAAKEHAAALYFEAAQPLLKQEQFGDAVTLLRESAANLGNQPQLQLALGVAYYGLRRYDEAAQAFLTTIALEPFVPQPYLFLGKMLDQIPQRLPEATQRFAEFEKANPNDYQGYLLHAKALNAQAAEPEKAKSLLERAISMNPSDGSAHFELGSLLERMRLFPDAAAEFERAATLEPGNAATHYHLSRLYTRLGKPEEAAAEGETHRKLLTVQNASR